MSNYQDTNPTEDELMERSRSAMNRMILIIQKVKDRTATESELVEYKEVSDKVDRIPPNTLTG